MTPRASRLSLGEGRVRRATRADGPELCRLFREIPMQGDLQVRFERDPDFFALYDIQRAAHRTVVLEVDDPDHGPRLEGLGTVLVRDGYLGGAPARLAYLCDLRLSPRIRGGRFLGAYFPEHLRAIKDELGFDAAYTVILDDNRAARWALVRRHKDHPTQPLYTPLRRFDIVNLQFTWPRARRTHGLRVRRAQPTDLERLAVHLDADHRRRPLGHRLDIDALAAMHCDWPGFGIGNFYLAEDGRGALRGACAVWDPSAVKTFRLVGYRGRMVWVRRGFNALAWLFASARLPPPGGALRFFYLTHVSVPDDDPRVMAALLDRVYGEHRRAGYHFLTAALWENDPLAPAFARYQRTSVGATLYLVTDPDRPPDPSLFAGRPGFEVALV